MQQIAEFAANIPLPVEKKPFAEIRAMLTEELAKRACLWIVDDVPSGLTRKESSEGEALDLLRTRELQDGAGEGAANLVQALEYHPLASSAGIGAAASVDARMSSSIAGALNCAMVALSAPRGPGTCLIFAASSSWSVSGFRNCSTNPRN